MDDQMDENVSENQPRRSGLGLHELGEDLQDLGLVTVNLAGDLLQLLSVVIKLPFMLLPEETRSHLKAAAREAGLAAQAVVEGTVSTMNDRVQQFNQSLRETTNPAHDELDDSIVIEDEPVEMGESGEAADENLDREVVEPNLQG